MYYHIVVNFWGRGNRVSERKRMSKTWFSNLDVFVFFCFVSFFFLSFFFFFFFLFQKNYCLFYPSMLFHIQFTFWHMTQIMSKYRILNNLKMLKSKIFFHPIFICSESFFPFPADNGILVIISLLNLFHLLGV